MKKIIALAAAAVMAFSVFAGCSNGAEIDMSKAPDYSSYDGEFITYGYHSPIPAAYYYDDDVVSGDGTDYRTVERYKEYLDCGLNTMFLQSNDAYNGEDFATSQLKKNMDTAKAAGIDKVIVCDGRLHKLSGMTTPVYGENTEYATFDDLVTYVKECLKPYIAEDNFFGVMLWDEPAYDRLPQVANTYKAIKKAFPLAKSELEEAGTTVKADEIFVQVNLLPMYGAQSSFIDQAQEENKDLTLPQAYRKYIETYVKLAEADNITVDTYPILQSGVGDEAVYSIVDEQFACIQIMAEVAAEYGCTLGGVSCSCELARDLAGNDVALKGPDMSEMYYQVNSYMMFGFRSFSYYTYWAKTSNAAGGYHLDNTSFINRDGSKGPLYDIMTDIHAEMQEMAPTLMNFEYKSMNEYRSRVLSYPALYTTYCEFNENFDKLENVTVGDDNIVIVTELYDDGNDQYMYGVMNPQAPSNGKYGDVSVTATLQFGSEFSAVEVWHRGEKFYLPLEDGKVTFDISAGYAVYVLPF